MTAPNAATLLKQLARRIRNADREAFDLFIDALDVYTIEAMEGLTTAPQEAILCQQGRAQQCQAFLRLFRECHIEKPTQPQAPTPPSGNWAAP